ncbi:hypothetical protein [Streptomyces roseicoloratus]|uniref:hypothetical protein n=1 Tax=Streptomyces roseicoloratus TaxID=2508722 RepID=UPI001009BBC7|nr:hypothetical protein [Streptomyces roseicoloratus]
MKQENGRRIPAATKVIVLGVCLAVLGGIGSWLLLGGNTAEACNGLPENERVRKSLGAAVQPA